MSAYEQPQEYLPEFSSSDFLASSDSLSLAKANSLYARLAGSNIMSGTFNTFNNPVLIDNIILSNAGSTKNNIFLCIDLNLITAITTGYNNISIGSQSLKFLTTGYQNIALGVYAGYNFITGASDNISIGANANSDVLITPNATIGAIAIGASANSNDNYSIALGYFSTSSLRSIALGALSTTLSTDAVAIGYNSTASGASSVSIGHDSTASFTRAVAIGNGSIASSNSSVAIGHTSSASAINSVALGDTATANNSYTISIGPSSTASGNSSIVMGHNSSATATNSICIGDTADATAIGAIVLGRLASASGINSTAIGLSASTVAFTTSTALGSGATSTSNNQIMIGTVTETVQMPNALNVIGNATLTLPIFISQPLMNYTVFSSATAKKQGHTTTSTTSISATTGILTNKNYATVAITSAIGLGSYFIEGMVSFSTPVVNSQVDLWINNVSANQDLTRTQVFFTNGVVIPTNWNCRITTQLNATSVTTNVYLSGNSLYDLTIGSVSLRVVRL